MSLFLPSRYIEKLAAGRPQQVWVSNKKTDVKNAKPISSSSCADKCEDTGAFTCSSSSNKYINAGASTSSISSDNFINIEASTSSGSLYNYANGEASTSCSFSENYINTQACISSSSSVNHVNAGPSSSSSGSSAKYVNTMASTSSRSDDYVNMDVSTSSSSAANYKKIGASSDSKEKGDSKAQTVNTPLDPLKDPNRKFKIVKVLFSKEENNNESDNKVGPKQTKNFKNKVVKNECKSTAEVSIKRGRKEKVMPAESILKYTVRNSNNDVQEEKNIKSVANKKGTTSRKRRRENVSAKESKEDEEAKVPKKSEKAKKDKIPDVSALDFSNKSESSNGKAWNLKISSWNINGIRAWLEKDGLTYLHHEKPDILCLQETKCSDEKLPDEVKNIDDYHCYFLAGDKDGYSGVGLVTKKEPLSVEYGIGAEEHDSEGRVITAEYEEFYLVSAYVPNAGRGLVRLEYRQKWDQDFRDYLKKLDEKKPVILCGDLNVAHQEIDLANPKNNKRNAGFTVEEREGFTTLLGEGFIDSFRQLYPDVTGAYTFWTYMMNARAKNVGWRLDYFVISKKFEEKVCDNVIRKGVYGSDHCPITLFLAL